MPDLTVIEAEPPGENVVAFLESILARAREGEFSSISAAYVHRDGSTGSDYSEVPSLAALCGAVTALQAKIVADMLE